MFYPYNKRLNNVKDKPTIITYIGAFTIFILFVLLSFVNNIPLTPHIRKLLLIGGITFPILFILISFIPSSYTTSLSIARNKPKIEQMLKEGKKLGATITDDELILRGLISFCKMELEDDRGECEAEVIIKLEDIKELLIKCKGTSVILNFRMNLNNYNLSLSNHFDNSVELVKELKQKLNKKDILFRCNF
ncbi:hypothetical protein SAMN02745163_01870 [Clostridium cavendishii DSM 21758]|uniref:Uncharacterized protein n=1 Tax=Clostridium cavendishii DSM 21758 TaxID=1121302 RepID=A0A1M6IZX0_9CLOT|nr:hypothetical protein [Clostridium cavendishii]SHJ40015.1 hypothetical protein SAMN02745163_01870 [Clostridium cavendishii DSM 21758]